jgi:chitodextrinase
MAASEHLLNPLWRVLCGAAVVLAGASQPAGAQDLQRMKALLDSVTPGSWVQVNVNSFSSAFPVGSSAVPSSGISDPGAIVRAWSSFTWDSNRGNLLLFGGGHYNYLGNEIYVLNGSTGAWTLGSLPSAVFAPDYMVTDNSAPQSAHTYDNNVFLQVNDRFMTFGGATHPYGGIFRAPIDGVVTRTGPWMWNPSLANPSKVGGSSGSGYDPSVAGGMMWTDRRLSQSGATLASHINGTTAYRTEDGRDVVYVTSDGGQSGLPKLYRYTVGNLANGESDQIEWIGRSTGPASVEGAGTIDTARNLYVRTNGVPANATDLLVWKLTGASSTYNALAFGVDLVKEDGSPLSLSNGAGLDYDEILDQYVAWDGTQGGTVYVFRAETDAAGNLLPQWHATTVNSQTLAQPTGKFVWGVFGKWKYIKQLGAYLALDEYNTAIGDAGVWLYKPPVLPGAQPSNLRPTISVTAPAANATFTVGSQITLTAQAADADGSIAKVEFFDGASSLGSVASAPYSVTWTTKQGPHLLMAVATDNRGAQSVSSAIAISVSFDGTPIVRCAAEDVDCALPVGVLADVFYGANGLYAVKRGVSGSLPCSTLTFGVDPVPGQPKSCFYAITPQTNLAPIVQLTWPPTSETFATDSKITLSATASDPDGSVTKVEFFDGSTLLGSVAAAPYLLDWSPQPGPYAVTARATDDQGKQSVSAAATGWIGTITFCASEGATCALPAGATADVYFGNGQFAVKRNLSGSIPCNSSYFGGDPAPSKFKACYYAIRSQSSNAAPTVALTSPTASGTYSAGSAVNLSATAADADGTVVKVEFFDGTTSLGIATAAPYTLSWTATLGVHSFTAQATDNLGAQTTSAPVTVSITGGSNVVLCAAEGGNCVLPFGVVADVSYGAGSLFAVKRNVSGSVPCTNQYFGADPAPGKLKSCYYTAVNQGSNIAPTVTMTSPTASGTYSAGAVVTVAATASDSDGSIAQVEFFDGTTSLGVATSAPYSLSWTAALGAHSFTARATDNLGAQTTSAPVALSISNGSNVVLCAAEGATCALPPGTVADVSYGASGLFAVKRSLSGNVPCTNSFFGGDPAPGKLKSCYYTAVNQGSNIAPTVVLTSPTASGTYSAGAAVTVAATASDSDGSIAQVEFFDGTTSLGVATSAPYSLSWTAALGAHSFTARATDNLGAQTTSAPVALSISNGSNVVLCAAEGATCALPPGTVADVSYGASGLFAVKRSLSGNVPCTNSFFGGDPAPGKLKSCYYTAVNQGSNIAPTVVLTSPTASGTYSAGAAVTVAATASDSDGTVAKVEFFDGATSLGVATSAPYSLSWIATLGAHSFTARATDNLGAQTTSAPVALSISTGSNVVLCAAEGSTCVLPAGTVADVSYGANGLFSIKRNLSGNIPCTNQYFGADPAPGKLKSCYYTIPNQ